MCRNVYRECLFSFPPEILHSSHILRITSIDNYLVYCSDTKGYISPISLKVLSEHTKVYSTDQVPRLSPKVPGRLKSYLPRYLGPRGLTGSRKDFIHQRLELTFIRFSRISFQERREMVASFPLCKKNHLTCCLWTVQLLAQTN